VTILSGSRAKPLANAGGTIPIFNGRGSGIIFKPGLTVIKCGKGGDSGGHCSGHYCPSTTSLGSGRWDYPGDGCGGCWRVSDFGIFLQRQARWQRANQRLEHNEIIVDGDATTAQLPGFVDAFFHTSGEGSGTARAQRELLLRDYGHAVGAIPLVSLNTRNWRTPFSASK